MLTELERLIALQNLDLEIRTLESRLKQIPEEVAALEQQLSTQRANLAEAQQSLSGSQKERRSQEGELELFEQKVSKYKDQLMQVKTNEEYKAMQKQIENFQEERRVREDRILELMEEADRLSARIKERGKELRQAEGEVRQQEDLLRAEAARLGETLASKKAERETVTAEVPAELLAEYQRVSKQRGGVALAEAKDEFCMICHVRLRPQIYSEIRQGKEILRCDNCSRFLYYLGPPPGTAGATEEERSVSAGDSDVEMP
jgi:hypothetical protein